MKIIIGLTEEDSSISQDVGTILWTAPEALKNPNSYTEKSDVYSFGVVLWEIFHPQRVPYDNHPVGGTMDPLMLVYVISGGLRPEIDSSVLPQMADLMKRCFEENPAIRPSTNELSLILKEESSVIPLRDVNNIQLDKITPPVGQVCLAFQDIENSTNMWEDCPQDMKEALILHNDLVRKNLDKFRGYEVKFEGDAFMVAFGSVTDAINWGIQTQLDLMNLPWPQAILEHKGYPMNDYFSHSL